MLCSITALALGHLEAVWEKPDKSRQQTEHLEDTLGGECKRPEQQCPEARHVRPSAREEGGCSCGRQLADASFCLKTSKGTKRAKSSQQKSKPRPCTTIRFNHLSSIENRVLGAGVDGSTWRLTVSSPPFTSAGGSVAGRGIVVLYAPHPFGYRK